MLKQLLNVIFKKNIMAPPLSWRTSMLGARLRRLGESIIDFVYPNKIGKEFSKVMQSNPSQKQVDDVCKMFSKETGINIFMTNPADAYCFSDFANIILNDTKKGKFPKDIKYVIFGHGSGTSLAKTDENAWHVVGNPKVKIFDFIEQKVPYGNKVLINCCEETPKSLRYLIPKNKPAIGNSTYTDATSSYRHPLKIVESGKREIIGGYANGITTLYK